MELHSVRDLNSSTCNNMYDPDFQAHCIVLHSSSSCQVGILVNKREKGKGKVCSFFYRHILKVACTILSYISLAITCGYI